MSDTADRIRMDVGDMKRRWRETNTVTMDELVDLIDRLAARVAELEGGRRATPPPPPLPLPNNPDYVHRGAKTQGR